MTTERLSMPRGLKVLIGCAGAALALVAPASAFATDRFVDQDTGLDSGQCTSGSPCDSISFALGLGGTGDTIRVDDSAVSYNEGTIDIVDGASIVGFEFVGGDEGDIVVDGGGIPALRVQPGESAGTISGLTLRSTFAALVLADATTAVTGNRFDSGGNFQTDIDVQAGSPTISQNLFTDASVTLRDIGIVVNAASPTIIDNDFINLNTAIEGGLSTAAPNTRIEENEITGTHTSGVLGSGIFFARSTGLVIEDNRFSAPAAPGMNGIFVGAQGGSASATLRRNQVYDAGNGVFFDNTTSASMNGDVIGGSTQVGLGASDPGDPGGGDVTAKNVTIVGATGSNEEINASGAQVTIDSSIVGDEGATAGATDGSCVITRSRGPVDADPDGCGGFQITAAPSFVNAAADDYRLSGLGNTALVDQGDPAAPVAPDNLDFEGEKRAMDGNADCDEVRDIGADERRPGAPDAFIVTGPAEGATNDDSTPTFTFNSNNPCLQSFECKLDAGSFASCPSPVTFGPLAPGPHTLSVRALDLVPQAGPVLNRNFSIPAPPPATGSGATEDSCAPLRAKLKKAKSKKKNRKIRRKLKKLGC
jgi:hypothetical protein